MNITYVYELFLAKGMVFVTPFIVAFQRLVHYAIAKEDMVPDVPWPWPWGAFP